MGQTKQIMPPVYPRNVRVGSHGVKVPVGPVEPVRLPIIYLPSLLVLGAPSRCPHPALYASSHPSLAPVTVPVTCRLGRWPCLEGRTRTCSRFRHGPRGGQVDRRRSVGNMARGGHLEEMGWAGEAARQAMRAGRAGRAGQAADGRRHGRPPTLGTHSEN